MAAVMSAPIASRFVEAQGLRLHLLRAGQGTPLVLLHGWPEWSHAWRPVMARLAERHNCIAPDFRGFGRSQNSAQGPAEDATPDQLASDTLALADALGIERFGLVAHDVGSFVAQTIARRVPERLSGLFLFNCGYPGIGRRWVEPSQLPEIWYQFFHQLPWAAELVGSSRATCEIYLRHFLAHWSHRKDWFEPELDAWVDNFMQPGKLQGGFNWYRSVHASRMAMIEGRSEPGPPIGVPTRVFWGAHDPVLKAVWADRLGEFFSGDLQVDIAPDAGHFVHCETPERAGEEIARFFAARR